MNLNEDIILKELSGCLDVRKIGNPVTELVFHGLCFMVPGMEFSSHMVYLGRTEDLPHYIPDVESLFICVGGCPIGNWKHTNIPLLWIRDPVESILAIGNRILGIFSKYQVWEQTLDDIIDGEADLAKMVNVTMELLQNPINISNREMDLVIQSVDYSEITAWPVEALQDGGLIPVPALSVHSQSIREDKKRHGCYLIQSHGAAICCINIFENRQYMGCISLSAFHQPLSPSDFAILEHFAKKVEKFLQRCPQQAAKQFLTIKNGLKDLLDLMPVDAKQLQKIMEVNQDALGQEYHNGVVVCFVVRPLTPESAYPAEYICRLIEQKLASCVSFEYEPYVTSFYLLPNDPGKIKKAFSQLTEWMSHLSLEVGISRTFSNIMDARIYYRQAFCAMELGHASGTMAKSYPFDDWALLYVMQHCPGEFPLEHIFPPGLDLVLESRNSSQGVDYWATLWAYLQNECSVSATANALYLHRSTMLQRLSRLRQMVDLTTPEKRLMIRICMYCYDNAI